MKHATPMATPSMPLDKQLHDVKLHDVLQRRKLGQALNAKEFAVLAGLSYSTARAWFHLPGFPVFQGVVFWEDFVQWRNAQNGLKVASKELQQECREKALRTDFAGGMNLPPGAARILLEAG